MFRLEISESERWLIVKALDYFTDDAGLLKFLSEYEVDQDAMAEDLKSLLTKIGMLDSSPKSGGEK